MNKILRLVSIFGVWVSFTTATKVYAQPTISGITPTIGINKGTISFTIIGSGFQSGATVTLTPNGLPDIIGTPTTVIESNTITTTFDLKNTPIGSWSVVVTNPDNQSGTLTDGFKVIAQLLITEVYYDPPTPEADYEFIELYNPNSFAINLSNYKLADGTKTISGEGIYKFPTGTVIPDISIITVAQKGTGSYFLYKKYPDFEFNSTSPDIPDMIWLGGKIVLANEKDEVILSDTSDNRIDIVVWGTVTFEGVIPHSGVKEGKSIQRTPPNQDTDNCSVDFKGGTPTPTTLRNICLRDRYNYLLFA